MAGSFRKTAPAGRRSMVAIGRPVRALKARAASMSVTHSVSPFAVRPFGALSVTPFFPPSMNFNVRVPLSGTTTLMNPLLSLTPGLPLMLEMKYTSRSASQKNDSGVCSESIWATLWAWGGGGGAGGFCSAFLQDAATTAAATRTRLRSTMIAPLVTFPSQPLHEHLKPLVAAQRVEVGIVLEPLAVPESILDRLLEAGNGIVHPSHIRIRAGHVVQDSRVFRVDRVGPARPIE